MPDLNTPQRGYPLPHADNTLIHDVERLAQSLTMIDDDISQTNQTHDDHSAEVAKRFNHVRLNTLLNDNLFLI